MSISFTNTIKLEYNLIKIIYFVIYMYYVYTICHCLRTKHKLLIKHGEWKGRDTDLP